jgi:hypothetical protein
VKGFFILGAMVAALAGCATKQDDSLPVYLFLGQSNMVGMRSVPADLPADMRAEQPLALFFKGGAWLPLSAGVTEPKGFGPEISFSHEMAREGREFGLIKVSAGATTLAKEWSPTNPDGLYAKTIAQVEAAKRTRHIKVAGVLWMQGESDGQTAEMAAAYKANLKQFISAIRYDTGSDDAPFAVCRVTSPESQFPYTSQVRKAQEKVSASNYRWFDCDSLTRGPDNLHYDTSGQIRLGVKFADALKSMR